MPKKPHSQTHMQTSYRQLPSSEMETQASRVKEALLTLYSLYCLFLKKFTHRLVLNNTNRNSFFKEKALKEMKFVTINISSL